VQLITRADTITQPYEASDSLVLNCVVLKTARSFEDADIQNRNLLVS
jgi:hypothetical protein